ncbi:MAG: hypothetical protein KGJ13_05040 [Patescibacteria group bacterium]|nr:hypothetical protein [Patescibacteria group bacterium]
MSSAGVPIPVARPGVVLPIPTRSQLDAFNVNREGWEAITNSLYDSAAYPAAGTTQLSFFNLPLGQGTGFGGGTKTLSDTNMTLAGQMPANQEFLIQRVEVRFFPTVPAVAAANPSAVGAPAAAALVNDSYLAAHTGNLTLTIGSKPYLQEAPLLKFAPCTNFRVNGAQSDSSTAGAGQNVRTVFAYWEGRPYILKAPLRLVSNQNFGVTLNWPEGVQAITNPARIFLSLEGVFYRRSQ